MALQQELLKTSAIAILVLLHFCGAPLLPAPSTVALSVIQTVSLFGALLTVPAKVAGKVDVVPKTSFDLDQFLANIHALIGATPVKIAVLSATIVLLAKAIRMAGLDSSVMGVLVLACCLGAMSQCIVALPSRRESSCGDGALDAEQVSWPSIKGQEEVECESPLAHLAKDLFTVPTTMQSPMFDMEDNINVKQRTLKVDVAPKTSFDRDQFLANIHALIDATPVKIAALSATVVLLAKAMRMAGLDSSVMGVLVLACSLGAMFQCIVAPPFCRESSCGEGEVVSWPSIKGQDEVECESPLAHLAKDLFTVPTTMQSPMFDMED